MFKGDTFGELDLVLAAARNKLNMSQMIENLKKIEIDLVRHFTVQATADSYMLSLNLNHFRRMKY